MVQILSNMIRPVIWSLLLAILVGTISTLSSISLMGLSAWLIASAALQPPLYVLSLASIYDSHTLYDMAKIFEIKKA